MSPDLDVVPSLVSHGWLWKPALLTFALVTLVAVVAARRLVARRAVRRAARAVDGRGVVRGTLRGGDGVVALTLQAAARPSAPLLDTTWSWQADGLWLDTDEGRVAIAGPLEVIAGSRAAAARHGVPALVPDGPFADARAEHPWLARPSLTTDVEAVRVRAVRAGDSVVVTGTLEPVPAGEADYRHGERAWRLAPAHAGGSIELAARAPAHAVLRLSVVAALALVGVTTVVPYWVLDQLGDGWERRCAEADDLELTETHACALAAATPHRADALETLLARLRDADRDERTVRRQLAVASLVGCETAVGELIETAQLDEAAAYGEACGAPAALRFEALASAGRYEEAARVAAPWVHVWPRTSRMLDALIAGGDWLAAAAIVERTAAEWLSGSSIEEPRRIPDAARCFVALLRHHGGDAGALASLRDLYARSTDEGREGCGAMLAELVPEPERAALRTGDLGEQLAWAAGGPPWRHLVSPEQSLVDMEPAWRHGAATPWLIDLERARLQDPRQRTALRLRWLTVARVLDGDLAAARALAAEAVAGPEPLDHGVALPATVELYSPSVEFPIAYPPPPADLAPDDPMLRSTRAHFELHFARLFLRNGRVVQPEPDDLGMLGTVLEPALAGEGERVAEVLRSRVTYWSLPDLVALLPRLRSGQAAVADAIRWRGPRSGLGVPSPFQTAYHAVQRRTAMQLLGQAEDARRWDAIYRRVDEMLADRRRLTALVFAP